MSHEHADIYTSKERLLRVLRKEKVERPPVICTGGMMNAAIIEIMQNSGHTLPEAHVDPQRMADLAQDVLQIRTAAIQELTCNAVCRQ